MLGECLFHKFGENKFVGRRDYFQSTKSVVAWRHLWLDKPKYFRSSPVANSNEKVTKYTEGEMGVIKRGKIFRFLTKDSKNTPKT